MARKTLLSIVQTVAGELNLPQPTVVITSQDQSVLKLLALVRAVCDDLLMEFDWEQLQTRYSFNTVPGTDNYPFPTDIERWINGTFFDQTNRWPLRGPKTAGEWEFLKSGLVSGAPFTRFRIFQGKFYVMPTPTAVYTFNMEYISANYVQDSGSGNTKSSFTNDSDICLFDHRVVIYGVKAKWLASIGQDNSAAMAEYARALEFAKGSDSPAPRLSLSPAGVYPLLTTNNIPDGSWTT